jgi:(p)ppGpp synthase/HD superfamily hydrolase
MDVK